MSTISQLFKEEPEKEVAVMISLFPLSSQVESEVFAAQACSCACDPCTCGKQCQCQGAEAYLGPRWSVEGEHILAGQLSGVDMAGRIIMQLAVTTTEKSEDWQAFLLIDEQATQRQVEALLEVVQQRRIMQKANAQEMMQIPLPVYLAPMRYVLVEQRPTLCASVSEDRLHPIRKQQAAIQRPLPTWTYNGHVALRERLASEVVLSASNVVRHSP